jgi:hypothetical protein
MRAVVFAGPSIAADKVASFGVEAARPVVRGDIGRLMASDRRPGYIGIVDGVFLQGMMISPKEILAAMDEHGVRVFGASSVGALRAAELACYGMTGIGQVYEMYRSGEICDDDEVAMTFDAESLSPLCEPMVNIRVALAAAVTRGVVGEGTAATAARIAKELYFPDRSYARVVAEMSRRGTGEDLSGLLAFLTSDAPNAKEGDALDMLRAMRAEMDASG